MNLLFSIDDNFVTQLQTTLLSIYANTKNTEYNIYVLQKEELKETATIIQFCNQLNMTYIPLIVDDELFQEAPVSKRYPEAIYYRLLAFHYLPESMEKILYLDADILCINDLTPLYELALADYLYAAASHSKLTNVTDVINKVRLKTYESEGYFNSGVLLMNLQQIRAVVRAEAIYQFIEDNKLNLLLPDQDILNGLYGERIMAVPDQIYNYDVRKNATYELISKGEWDLDWIIQNAVFLHFCGKDKPWEANYRERYSSIYKHYEHKAKLLTNN